MVNGLQNSRHVDIINLENGIVGYATVID